MPKAIKNPKGFTLIELIVTIAILAVLVTIVVVAINPAEQLQRSRDSKRAADLDALRAALNLYLSQATGTIDLAGGANASCKYGGGSDTVYTSGVSVSPPSPFVSNVSTTTQTVGTGWAPARIDQTPGGASVSNLPLDPTNSGSYFYLYVCDFNDKTFEFTARLESTYFLSDLDLDGKDGGDSATTYEVGSKLTIIGSTY